MKNSVLIVLAVLLLAVGYNTLYVVKQTEKAVLLQFGALINPDIPPGLHIKIPWVQEVRKYEGRIQIEDSRPERFLTLEQKALMVDSYAKWRIVDVEEFYLATSAGRGIGSLLAERINNGLRDQIGARTLQEVVAGERDQLMQNLTQELNETVGDDFGIVVIDARVKRIDLPDDVLSSVYDRMTTERRQEAQQLRSQGRELAIGIEADADRQAAIHRAEAYRDAQIIRGEGEAEATAIYAEAYGKDPEFFDFIRSLNAYRETFSSKNDVLLLDSENEFFKYLKAGADPEPSSLP